MNNWTSKLFVVIASILVLDGWLKAGPPPPPPPPPPPGPPTENDVGDPDSFKHGANYLGVSSGFIYVNNCPATSPTPTPSPAPNNNGIQCFTTQACPGSDSFDAFNIAAIVLPKDSTKDIIYPVLNFFHDVTLENTSGSPQNSVFFQYTADITIESSALNVPSCTDPGTGNPCGGQLQFQFGDNRMREDRSMNPGDRERQHLNYTRAGNLGITKRSLVESGLSQQLVDNLFHSQMTLRLNVHIQTRCVNQTTPVPTIATIIANMRLFGD
jgi:hypothetical protein